MLEIRTSVIIEAPKKLVWDTFMDIKSYPHWNTFFSHLDGDLKEGGKIKVSVVAGSNIVPIQVEVTALQDYQRFAWALPDNLVTKHLLNGEHYFELEELDDGSCQFIHGEEFKGVVPRLSWTLLKRAIPLYEKLNHALKKEVESRV